MGWSFGEFVSHGFYVAAEDSTSRWLCLENKESSHLWLENGLFGLFFWHGVYLIDFFHVFF